MANKARHTKRIISVFISLGILDFVTHVIKFCAHPLGALRRCAKKMNRLLLLLLLAIVTISNAGAADPAPILVVREMDPWRMVIGSDSAKFAIYDNGSVIYQTAKPTAERPFSRRMIDDPAKVSDTLLGFDPEKVNAEYELSSATDQISTTIWTPKDPINNKLPNYSHLLGWIS